MPLWTWLVPVLALGALLVAWLGQRGAWLTLLCGAALAGAVFAAVHHAEVVAHRLGEPFGTLVLALAVTAIESALILSMMVAGGQDMAVLARDSIYAAVMIICNGVVGLCLLVGGIAHRVQTFRVEGAGAGLAALIVMARCPSSCRHSRPLLPAALTAGRNWHSWRSVRRRSGPMFVFVQTMRHRNYFIPAGECFRFGRSGSAYGAAGVGELRVAFAFARHCGGFGQDSVAHHRKSGGCGHAPRAVVGIVIAGLVLLPETWAAVRAARANRLQTSMNLAIGSALATIGLTVPLVVVASIVFDLPLVLGLRRRKWRC